MASPFNPNSRYANVPQATLVLADGRRVAYALRRFVSPPDRFALVREHVVSQGERLDGLAAAYLGDPEAFWLLADANGAMDPDELTNELGRRLRITMPEGIPGGEDA